MMVRQVGFACAAILLSSCGEPGASDGYQASLETVQAMTPQWQELADGSKFARTSANDGQWVTATRCWGQPEDQFECVKVSEMTDLGTFTASMTSKGPLPKIILTASADNGYECSWAFAYHEKIRSRGEQLTSNMLQGGHSAWTSSYVRKYMADNNVVGSDYFRCLELLRVVRDGSVATVGTTSVTRDMLQ